MGVFRADLGWAALAVFCAAVAVHARRSPVDHPLPISGAIGAVFGFTAALVGLPIGAQAAVAGVAFVALLLMFWRWRVLSAEDHLPPGVGGRRLVGLGGETIEPLGPTAGRIRVGSEVWQAVTTDDVRIPTGTAVRIIGVEGIRVVVTPVSESAETDQRGS